MSDGGVVVRGYRDGDQDRVLALLSRAFDGWPELEGTDVDPVAFFRWKHTQSPFGRSRMAVAERDGEIVGFRAFMPWMLRGGGRTVRAVRSADAATVPELQRTGVFGEIRRAAESLFGDPVELYFGTPNASSLGATAKLGGRSVAGMLPAWTHVRLRHACGALLRGTNGAGRWEPRAERASEVLADAVRIDELLADANGTDGRLATAKDGAWLRWRYGEVPLDYRVSSTERGGRLRSLAIFRIRARRGLPEAVIEELFVPDGERRAAAQLLRDVSRAAPVALCSCCFPPRTTQRQAALRRGFVRWRGGSMIVVKETGAAVSPPPAAVESWALTLGDLELV